MTALRALSDYGDAARDDLPEHLEDLQRHLASLRRRIWRTRDTCDMRRARQIELRISQIDAAAPR